MSTLTGGLLYSDRKLCWLSWLVMAVPTLIQTTVAYALKIEPNAAALFWPILIVERLIQLAVGVFIVHRWYRTLLAGKNAPRISFMQTILRSLSLGIPLWLLLITPLSILPFYPEGFATIATTVSLVITITLTLRYYFYFATAGLYTGSFKTFVLKTRALTFLYPRLPLQAIFAPIVTTFALVTFLTIPYPDGRSLLWQTIAACGEPLFWLLSVYTGLSLTLLHMPQSDWELAGLDPYRKERLETLASNGHSSWFFFLSRKGSINLLIVAICLMLTNTSRQLAMAPSPTLTIGDINTSDNKVHISVTLRDPEFRFHGFYPHGFTLAGKTGTPVSVSLTRVWLGDDPNTEISSVPATADTVTLHLEFAVDRAAKDLVQLQDLWLWYQLHPMVHLDPELLLKSTSSNLDSSKNAI